MRLVSMHHVTRYVPVKAREYLVIFPNSKPFPLVFPKLRSLKLAVQVILGDKYPKIFSR